MEQRGESSGTGLYRHVAKQHKENSPVVNERMFNILMVKCQSHLLIFFCSKQQVRSTFLTCSIKLDPNTVDQKKISHFSYIRIFSKSRYNISCMIVIIGNHVFSC